MYIPKHRDWIFPVAEVLTGFYIQERAKDIALIGFVWDVGLLVQLPLVVIGILHGLYIWQAGVMYQGYMTGTSQDVDKRQAALDAQAKQRAWDLDHPETMTGGNTPVYVPVMDPAMVEYQFVSTAPALDSSRVTRVIKRICKRQFTYRDHLGKPEGDYRESVWGELTRKELTVALEILKHAGGIRRKTRATNSTYITARWDVIQMGAQGTPLPHPKGCKCDDCAVK
jgi:hypothetical protein